MFSKVKLIFLTFTKNEKIVFFVLLFVFVVAGVSRVALAVNENSSFIPIAGGSYIEGEVGQPIAINPIISQNQPDLDIGALVYARLADLLVVLNKSKDGLTYDLKLKDGLKWSDGQPLTSDDVIFTIQTIQNPATQSPLAQNWNGITAERISQLEVQLTLPAPYAFFKDNVNRLLVLPQHVFGAIPSANLALSDYNLEPIASGPYRFNGLTKEKDGFITDYFLTANKNWSGEPPLIKNFSFKFFSDLNALTNALNLRQINGFGSLTPLPENFYNIGNTRIENIPMPRYYALFFNQNVNPALKSASLRQGLIEAIDKNEINQTIFNGHALIIDSPLFSSLLPATTSFALNTSSTASSVAANLITSSSSNDIYDLATAQKLVSTAKKNSKLTINLIVPQIDFLKKTADLIKKDWLAAGVDEVNITALAPNDLMNNVVKARNYEVLLFGNALENPMDLFPFWDSSQRVYPGLNLALYQNSRVDTYLEALRGTEDPIQATDYLNKAVNLILADNPAAFLFSLPYTYIHTDNLNGFAFSSSSQYMITPADRFKNVELWSVAKARIIK